jgi:hypothetical protein
LDIFPSVIVGDSAGMAKLCAAKPAEVVRKAVEKSASELNGSILESYTALSHVV